MRWHGMCRKRVMLLLAISFGLVIWIQGGLAQDYPTKQINLLICMQPGAGVDLGARIIAKDAGRSLGQEMVPVNRSGGGGAVAAAIVSSSKGDGYTLLACTLGCYATTPHLESIPYEPIKDLVPIVQFGSLTAGIVVRADSPFKSFRELIDYARKNPGKVSYGFPGIGTGTHLAIEHVMMEEKVDIVTVPYDGATPAMSALLGGHISACGISTSGFLPNLKAGKVRVLATTGDRRIEVVPDAPPLVELGYRYGVLMDGYVIFGPKGIPPAVTKALEGAVLKAMETQTFQTLADSLYMRVPVPLHGQKVREYMEGLYARNGEIIKKAKLNK
jgi:tripartite-type tricarboxylate transporter receptor subunit TctC